MKNNTEIIANGQGGQDVIISHIMTPIYVAGGKPDFTDEPNKIAKHKGCVTCVTIYLSDGNGVQKVNIDPKDIIKLADMITAIEYVRQDLPYDPKLPF